MDSANPVLLSEDDSKIAIAQAIRQAMEERGISFYQLHEATGLFIEVVNAFIAAEGDISDSLPITKIERELRVNLTGL